jgi:hypothetical protein
VTLSEAERASLTLGWRVYGIQGDAAPYKAALRTLLRLSTDKAFRKGLDALGEPSATSNHSADTKGKPAPKANKQEAQLLKLKGKTIAGMPVGSEVIALEIDPATTQELLAEARRKVKRGKKSEPHNGSPMRALLAVVPDGNQTFIVFAMDESTLLDRAKVVHSSSKAPRLSTRTDLQVMRGLRAYQAGFSTLELAKGWLQSALVEQKRSAKEADTLFATLPHHGTTPIFYSGVVVGSEKQPVVEISTSVPRAVFEDAAAAVPTLMMLFPD